MRKYRKALSLITSILVGIISFTGPVYAEGEDSGTATIQDTPAEQVYDTNHGDDSDPANNVSIKYTFDDQQAEVAIVAWHQSNSVNGEESARNAEVMKLPGGKDVSLTLQNFYSGSKRGNLIVVVKAKPGYLITGLNALGSSNAFYAITANDDGTIKPITDLQQSYTGINEAEQKAYDNSPVGGKYQILFNYFQTATSPNHPTDFEIITEPAEITVTTSKVIGKVKIGDTITLTSKITPKEIKTDKGAVVGSLSISSLDEKTLIETVNGKSVNFSKGSLEKNQGDGSWTRIVEYTVQPEDVSSGKINYSLSATLHYDYTLNVKNGTVTTSADAEANDSAFIDILSNVIQIKGESSTVVYDGKPHSESGAMINDLFPLKSDGPTDITVNGVKYQVSGINITPAKGIDAGSYPSTIDITNAAVTSLNNAGQSVDVKSIFTIEQKPGSLTITPASLLISNIDSPVYNGQDQKLAAVVKGNIDGSPKLVDGKDYDLSYSVKDNDYKNAGTTVTVTATGKGNYQGSSATATYTILPRPLRVGTNSNSKIYDGKPLTAAGSIDGAVTSDNLRLITTGSQTDVGSSQNTYRIDYGNAKADNYKVVGESIGTLTVYAPAPKPNGRTCQQDGYAAGYAWDDAQQACVLRVRETSPSIKNVPGTGALRK